MNITDIRKKAFLLTDEIITLFGPRLSGTKAALDAADKLYNEMDSFTDTATKQHFFVHQGAFMGWIRILVSCYFLGVLFLWLNVPIVSVILLFLGILILVLEFFMYLPVIDFLFPKKSAVNVIGTIEPKEDVREQIIISGHHDSAHVFNFFIHQPKLYNLRVTGGIVLVFLLFLVSITQLFPIPHILQTILTIIVSLGCLLTGQLWFFSSKKGTPGAGDNLIASTMAIEIGRHFSENKLNHTRLIIASFDAEEEGLRGARAYAKENRELLQSIPTTLLNTDCPYYLKDLFFLTSDINGSVQMSVPLAEELCAIATTKNYPNSHKPIAFLTGGSDAGELAKVGVEATTLMAMPWTNNERAAVYHTPQDTTDAIEVEAIDAAIDIFTQFILNRDKK